LFNLKDRIANINKCLSWSSSEANGIVQKKYNFETYTSSEEVRKSVTVWGDED